MIHFNKKSFTILFFLFGLSFAFGQPPQVGAFYFDGWSQVQWDNLKRLNYQEGPINDNLINNFPEREPAYGWVNSTQKGMQLQINDAFKAGLDFFIFDWYYCNDSGYNNCQMNHALRLFMANEQKQLKFTTMITNDSYNIGPKEWDETKENLKTQFSHPAYFRLEGRPVMYIYLGAKMIDSFGGIRNFKRALKDFKMECFNEGLNIPLIGIANIVEDYSLRRLRYADFLFTYNQPVLVLHNKKEPIRNNLYHINDMIESEVTYWSYLEREAKNKKFVPTITAGWDRRPWDEKTRVIYTPPTREYIKGAVQSAMNYNKYRNGKSLENMILIYAWNEYGEGGYIARMKDGNFIGMGIADAKREEENQ